MQKMIPPDPESSVSTLEYAVIYIPRRSRNRFAATCVEIKSCAAEALNDADPDNKRYAARVSGPSKSSEGLFIYYLVEWLE